MKPNCNFPPGLFRRFISLELNEGYSFRINPDGESAGREPMYACYRFEIEMFLSNVYDQDF